MIEGKYEQKLTDYILLEDLRKKLWTSDGKSRVSIMIGAGFSRNASKLDSSLKSMSLWSDLRKKLLEQLGDDKEYNDLDVLSLGDIYEEKFGIINLENLLKTEIPDENYEPNFLYTKLLSLPFADVYTTNYDTLLERASRDVFNRRYQVIHDIHDIPGSVSPRIVKLHGTFPSHRPFVFSKKSYDSYPSDSAPFVNMVQQSIMETTLVLVGFSGDDPNFKKWIEWVSNSLGEHRPKIYLLGLNIDEKNSIFRDNNISIIDFSEVYNDLGTDNKYVLFFDELFDYLSDNPTIDQRKWPYTNYPHISSFETVDIIELITTLKKNRETYPGWLIMPSKIKNRRWMEQFISNYFDLLEKDISLEIKTNLAVELVWLLRTFRIPILFPHQKRLENIIKDSSSDNNDERIINLVLFLIREARLDVSDDFFEYIDLIDEKSLHSNHKNELTYQKLLWEIDILSEDVIKSKIYSWEIGDNSLDYKIRKAAILFRLNENEEALIIIKNILQNARRIQSISRKNYFALSVEGIVLTLLQKFERGSMKENYFDRLIELDQNFCTPATTIDYISNFRREKVLNAVEEKRTYDGKKTISYNIGNYGQSDEIDAFFLITLHEHYCIGINDRKRIEVLKYLYKNYPIYAQKKFFTFAKVKEIDEFFSKNKILNLNEKQINSLFSFLKNLLNSESKHNIDMVLDVLFRLYEVLHQNQREELENILIEQYVSNKQLISRVNIAKVLKNCFYRVVKTKYGNALDDFANKVFNLPMIGEEGTSLEYVELDTNFTFDPISEFRGVSGKITKISSNKYTVSKLINYLENSQKTSVRLASWERLLFLHKWNLISEKEIEELDKTAKKLIDKDDKLFRNYLKSFAINTFIRDEDYVEKYMEILIQKDFKESYSERGFSNGDGLKYQLDEVNNLLLNRVFSETIYINLFDKIKKWWANQYKWAKKHNSSEYLLSNDDLWTVVIFIKNTIFRNIGQNMFNSQAKKILLDCFMDLKEDENPGYILLIPGMLKIGYQADDIINDLRYKMLSSNEDYKNNAIVALQDIAYYKNKKEIDVNIRELKVLLLQLLAVYKESSLNYVSRTVSLILKEDMKFFTNIEVEKICTSVNRFFDLFLSSSEQTIFDQDDYIDIIKNYLNIIVELKDNNFAVDVSKWSEYCKESKHLEIKKYSYILEEE